MTDLEITYRLPGELNDNPRNVRTHSPRQLRQIARSITAFGFANPILVDEGDTLIAGHGRLAAARQRGLSRVPVIRLSELTEAQKRGLMLADNRISENAGWGTLMLARELADLSAMELDFDIEITGFDMAEIDIAIEGSNSKDAADIPETAPVSGRDRDRQAPFTWCCDEVYWQRAKAGNKPLVVKSGGALTTSVLTTRTGHAPLQANATSTEVRRRPLSGPQPLRLETPPPLA